MPLTRAPWAAAFAVALLLLPNARSASGGPAPDGEALVASVTSRAPGLRAGVLREALDALACAARDGRLKDTGRLTIIDYSLPSTQPRLWVLDTRSGAVLFHEHVAHGKNSGDDLTTRFSNAPNSLQTSLGLFATADTYVGQNGYSLRLDGLEPGVNDRARERAIVMHGAPYVDPALARRLGRLGRSWGCPAVSPVVARRLIDTIKGGTAVFAYHPRREQLASAASAASCGAPTTSRTSDSGQ